MPGAQNRLLVGDGHFLLPVFAQTHPLRDFSAVKNRQIQRGANGEGVGGPTAHVRQGQRLITGVTGQRNTRIIVGGGDADFCGCLAQTLSCFTNIRPA
ncbi:hypothetical protein D3C79_1026570 [compost metagenome]